MVDPNASLSPRFLSIAAIVCFAPIVVTFAVAPGVWWVPYPGIIFHLALFLLVPKLEAPDWAKAAGYGWLVLDVTAGVMTINGVPHAIFDFVRFGGHIFAGMWIVTASLSGSLPVKIVGVVAGSIMFLFTFVSPFVPPTALAPTAPLILLWLGIIAWQNGTSSASRMVGRVAAA